MPDFPFWLKAFWLAIPGLLLHRFLLAGWRYSRLRMTLKVLLYLIVSLPFSLFSIYSRETLVFMGWRNTGMWVEIAAGMLPWVVAGASFSFVDEVVAGEMKLKKAALISAFGCFFASAVPRFVVLADQFFSNITHPSFVRWLIFQCAIPILWGGIGYGYALLAHHVIHKWGHPPEWDESPPNKVS